MNDFSIDFKWLEKNSGDPVSKATFAEIQITAGKENATEVLDQISRTTRDGIRVSAYTLASWLAANWWRLRWEPEKNAASWKMSHQIGAAGEGFLWPALTFISDGRTILVQSRAAFVNSAQPIRYLNSFNGFIPADVFEHGIDRFLDAVIGRLRDLSINEEILSNMWNEVLGERRDPEAYLWRKLEAILGFDPDEAPESVLLELIRAKDTIGTGAVEELAVEFGLDASGALRILCNGARQHATVVKIPEYELLHSRLENGSYAIPWQAAAKAACLAREVWALGNGPLSNSDIAARFGIDVDFITKRGEPEASAPINAGYRDGETDVISASLVSPYQENRRFALFRLVGDHLTAPKADRLLPACANSKTYRQKFQKAFAQEVLCPSEVLIKYFGSTEPSDEAIEDAAHLFIVSPLMVKSILVNRRNVDRERFFDDTGKPL